MIVPTTHTSENISLFESGHNCWRQEKAHYASLVIDNANYYRALHEAICKARHSIFILGWDIDSRIELIRGEEARKSATPIRFFDTLKWSALQNPELMIYIDRWDFLFYLLAEREHFSKAKWQLFSPANIHYCLDGVIPIGASHHQKIVVIDDEIAFCGGMDIALCRWDHRDHHSENKYRVDPSGTYQTTTRTAFGPHYDVQMLVAGPIVQPIAELVRERWHLAAGFRALLL